MHKGIMGARRLEALNSITESIEAMGATETAEEIRQINHRDPELRALFMIEALATFLEKARDQSGGGMDRAAILDQIKADIGDGLTKTSTEALEAWAAEEA